LHAGIKQALKLIQLKVAKMIFLVKASGVDLTLDKNDTPISGHQIKLPAFIDDLFPYPVVFFLRSSAANGLA
jgi:hypothetical protein